MVPSSKSKSVKKKGVEEGKVKRARKVLTLQEKIVILDKLRSGMSNSACGREFGINESTVRTIKAAEKQIRHAVVSCTPTSAKVTQHVRNDSVVQMEKALNVWIEDMNRRHVPVDSNGIREKAKKMYDYFSSKNGEKKSFVASKGWFEKFKARFMFHNLRITGESASADHVAAATYPEHLEKLIKEKGYSPEQVFNADETGMWWKKMPSRTFISQEERQAPGFKAQKDRVSLLLCGNAAGHMIKPMFLYRAARPRALKGKDLHQLPVFYRSNKKAWVTAALFMDWFHNCFVPEVEKYLRLKEQNFKVLLIVDNCPGHPDALRCAHENVQVEFLPKNTTSLIQPLDQGVIAVFKAKYISRNFSNLLKAIDEDGEDLKAWWKKFNIAHCIQLVKTCHDELTTKCVNSCWKKLWPSVVHDFTGFPSVDVDIMKIKSLAKVVSGDGFSDLNENEIKTELLGHAGDELTEEEIEELLREDDKEKEEEEVSPPTPQGWTLEKLMELKRRIKHTVDFMMSNDPSLDRALKVKNIVEGGFTPYDEMIKELRHQVSQPKLTCYFSRVPTRTTAITTQPQPTTSGIDSDPDDPHPITTDDDMSDDAV